MAQLICRNLAVGYDGHPVLENLNFQVHAGEYLTIVGENGAGKSTLMKTILGLQPPLGGEIITGDGLHPDEIGYLPQQTQVQRDFPASVWEIVLSGCQGRCGHRFFYGQQEKKLAKHAIAQMSIETLVSRCYRELSGGQQQRVLLARALCATRKMLLMDEPVAGLDPKASADMYHIIGKLNREKGITILMITHDLEAADRYATHVLKLGSHGTGVFYGTREEYRRMHAESAGVQQGKSRKEAQNETCD